MSLGSQALERSTLEAKDRESLQQIAVAMGGKPTSRAKKADIIDLILELAGVGPAPAGSAAADDDAAESAAEAAPSSGAPGSRKRSTRVRGADPSPSEPGDADGNERVDDDAAASNRSGQDRNDRGNDRDESSDDGRGARSASSQEPGNRGGTSDDAAASQGSQQSATGSGQREDGESGNRRRRRRGRDRDRNRDNAQPGGPAPADEQWQGEPVEVAGLLDLRDEGYGFLRLNGYLPSRDDVYVSVKQVRQLGLRKGDHITGASRPAARNEKNPALLRIDEVNGGDPEKNRDRPSFEDLTAVHPDARLVLETADPSNVTARLIDLLAPVGKGQRGLIVSPPRAGKTSTIKTIATSIEANDPDVVVIVVLIDERPEEVNDMARSVKGEVVASTFDRPAEEHTMVAELALERAKRLVEEEKDVVVLFDGVTRLARAYNATTQGTGRTLASGIDTGALYGAKQFLAAARNAEEGGSLTILATVLVETGSALDDAIVEDLAGTSNLEVRLDGVMASRRIYPAIDPEGSSNRHEELLLDDDELAKVRSLRKALGAVAGDGAGLEMLLERLGTSPTNSAVLATLT